MKCLFRLFYNNIYKLYYLEGGGYNFGPIVHGTPGNLGAAIFSGMYYHTTCCHIYIDIKLNLSNICLSKIN